MVDTSDLKIYMSGMKLSQTQDQHPWLWQSQNTLEAGKSRSRNTTDQILIKIIFFPAPPDSLATHPSPDSRSLLTS